MTRTSWPQSDPPGILPRLRQGIGSHLRQGIALCGTAAALMLGATPAHAVPAFARQTGQDCIACHVGGFGPQLTPFGRAFKLSGYTLTDGKKHIPLSAMLVSSYTHTTNDITPNTDYNGEHANDNFVALQQASIFLAGRITDHMGMLGQATYEEAAFSPNFNWDNTDLRYAHNYQIGSTSGLFGISVNNNPTVSDVWNTVPAWQFGFMSAPYGGGYGPSPEIANLGQAVIGTTAYTLIDNHWYLEGGLYHGISNWWNQQLKGGGADAVSGYNPYWRLNYSGTAGLANYEVGLIGMNTKVDDGQGTGSNNTYKDVGVDASYQYINGGISSVTVNGLYMHERQNYTAGYVASGSSSNASGNLNFFNVNTAYWYRNTYGATIQFFNTTGSGNAGIYGTDPTTGAALSPETSGVVWEFDWNPFGKSWTNPEKNMRLGLQYTTYNKFNGSSQGASGNNSLYLYMWLAI